MMITTEEYIEKQMWYKIQDSHFKLGSKIHISDFYYAKRMFQNSFFSSRFAFIVAKELLKEQIEVFKNGRTNLKPLSEIIKEQGLTLVGYGLYSSLFMSQIEYFIKEADRQNNKINHVIIKDAEKLELASDNFIFFPYVKIIVPIASTFSTSMKIIQKLDGNKVDYKNILEPDYNILYVCNNEENSEIEFDFGIEHIENERNKVKVKVFYKKDITSFRIQKFLIKLPTKWHKNIKCPLCGFNDKYIYEFNNQDVLLHKEKPLYETDDTSVTPSIIFDSPKVDKKSQDEKIEINFTDVEYGHLTEGDNKVNLKIDLDKILMNNPLILEKWIKKTFDKNQFKEKNENENKKEEEYNDKNEFNQKVILIASGKPGNTLFINKINEILFNSSATIIHFNPETEHLQNFEMVYGKLINSADKRYFIDSVYATGSTFVSIRVKAYIKRGR